MRKTLLLVCLFISQLLMAGPVTQEQALQKATEFMAGKPGMKTGKQLKPTTSAIRRGAAAKTDAMPFYIFNADNGGFIIVSGDDRTEEILGYSNTGHVDEQTMPENMRGLLQEYADIITRLDRDNVPSPTTRRAARRISGKASIAPMLTSKWNQGLPYNMMTPYSEQCEQRYGYHCVTGCVATAMAQLMYYHKWPAATTTEIPAYTSEGNVGDFELNAIPKGTSIDWNQMQDTYTASYSGTAEENAVAKLMMMCGYSVEMAYGTSSGAVTSYVVDALVKYFDYEETTARFVYRENYSYDEWQSLIYSELEAGRPVLFSGRGAGGGHAFICDGYDKEDFFDINWGWGGSSNGYFRLNLLNPKEQGAGASGTDDGYAIGNGIAIGIQKNDGEIEPDVPAMTASTIYLLDSEKYDYTRTNSSQDFTGISIMYSAYNYASASYKWWLGLRILDSKGNNVGDIDDPLIKGAQWNIGTGWRTDESEAVPVTVSSKLPDGKYRIILTCRNVQNGMNVPDKNSENVYLPFTISGNTLHFNKVELEVGEPNIEGNGKANSPQTVSLDITNKGDAFHSDVYYYLNRSYNEETGWNYDAYTAAAYLDLEQGSNATIQFKVTPKRSGTNTVTVIATKNGKVLKEFQIEATGSAQPVFTTASVANFDPAQGQVNGKTLDVTLRLTNEGEASYMEEVNVALVDMDRYYVVRNGISWGELNVAPGESVDKQFVFENLSANVRYAPYISYKLNGANKTAWGDTYLIYYKSPKLEIKDGIVYNTITHDAEADEYVNSGDECRVSMDITNAGEADFNGHVWAYVRGYSSVQNQWWALYTDLGDVSLNIPIGETKTFEASFTNSQIQQWFGSYGFNKFQIQVRYSDEVGSSNYSSIYLSPQFRFGTPDPTFTVGSIGHTNENGNVVGKTFSGSLDLQNKGDARYGATLYTTLEYYNGNDVWTDDDTTEKWNVDLQAGTSTSKTFEYPNRTLYNSYRVKVWSVDNPELFVTPWYKLVDETPQPHLHMATTIENGTYNSEDRKNHVEGSTVIYKVKVENMGDATYTAESVEADLMVYNNETGFYGYQLNIAPTKYIESVNLPADLSFNETISWSGLQPGKTYAIYFSYLENGNREYQFGSSFTVDATAIKGDANNDGVVDINDVIGIANTVINPNTTGIVEENADVNSDGLVNVADMVATVKMIESGAAATAPRLMMEQKPAAENASRELIPSPTKPTIPELTEDNNVYTPTLGIRMLSIDKR
ncbi:MAG: C10 family peptidase [Prevotella sp.]|nr:C10 family peptidase [Prevotella sp.]